VYQFLWPEQKEPDDSEDSSHFRTVGPQYKHCFM